MRAPRSWWRILGPGAPRHVYPSAWSARADLEDGVRRDASGLRARLWRLKAYPTRRQARQGGEERT